MRWVKRNEDKPHRCPECHAVSTYPEDKPHGRWSFGPRTKFKCPRGCGVQWRIGRRFSRSENRGMKEWLKRLDTCECDH